MASFDELKNKGNDFFKHGHFELALEFYSKALEISPSNHIALSNRSLTFYKLERYDSALEEANKCIQANKSWAKGYIRKAAALNALGKYKEAKEVCVVGFTFQEQSLCKLFMEEWLKASRSLVDPKFGALLKPPWFDVLPEAADLFCDEYCTLLHKVVYLRLSDSQSMSHNEMAKCVIGAVGIAEDVLEEFHHPTTPSLKEWAEAATIHFESHPKSEWSKLMDNLHKKSSNLLEWIKNDVHKSLRLVLDPILMLALSAMLVRGNVLCQAYTGHHSTEYLGYACVGFFEQAVLTDPTYTAFHMAVLSMILNSYRLRGALDENEVQLIRGLCHKLEDLLHHLPKGHKNYQLLTEHYQHTVKVFREICAKVITGFTGSHYPSEALSELELALLKCDKNPDMAMDVAVKYITDIARKTESSRTSSVSHINFIDAENMLYITGILAKLGQHDQALNIFHSGESMAFSLLATLLESSILSLDELPSSITNCRKLALSGAIWLKDHFPKDAADVFIRWKSLFTELRATLIRLGLRDCYREAFQAIESHAAKGDEEEIQRHQVQSVFQAEERKFLQKFSLTAIKALYRQDYDSVAQALQDSDVAIDYTFKIYNPEHQNPPQSQACVVVILPQKPPMIISISDKLVYDQLQKWPQAIYKLWYSQEEDFKQITMSLSDILFPDPIRKIILDPVVTRVFISPDADLMCFPIDQLPINDSDGSCLPLYERVSVSILSSPRELVRDSTVMKLRDSSRLSTAVSEKSDLSSLKEKEANTAPDGQARLTQAKINEHIQGSSQNSCTSITDLSAGCSLKEEEANSAPDGGVRLTQAKVSEHIQGPSQNSCTELSAGCKLAEEIAQLQLTRECFIVANPDYKLESVGQPSSSWKQWLGSFSALLGSAGQSEGRTICELMDSQKEAETVHRILSKSPILVVQPPLTQKEATITAILELKSPHILHLATHGYTSKQESIHYHGNFWTDESSGILLAGAQTFLDKKFEKMDVRAGTGHMNSIAMCGMQLEGTGLVYISACNSSVGSRPSQEMPASITHALRAAGTQTVISTLWIVSDTEATEFAAYFYEQLMTHPESSPSEALSYAKALMKQKGHSMFHWGSYVCHGVDYPLILSKQ